MGDWTCPLPTALPEAPGLGRDPSEAAARGEVDLSPQPMSCEGQVVPAQFRRSWESEASRDLGSYTGVAHESQGQGVARAGEAQAPFACILQPWACCPGAAASGRHSKQWQVSVVGLTKLRVSVGNSGNCP